MKALLVLEDGTFWEGRAIGKPGTTLGEVVFSTSMTGYQEMLSDPSYAGQILVFTYPLIGNYGITPEDFESNRVQVAGIVVRELCSIPSHWRSQSNLDHFLREHSITGIAEVDTRAITRRLRAVGVMKGGISTEMTYLQLLETLRNAPNYGEVDFVQQVSCKKPYLWQDPHPGRVGQYGAKRYPKQFRVALLDLGVKYNILRRLSAMGCEIYVFPCNSPAEALLEINPHGVVLSPGPGDPALLDYAIRTVKGLIGKCPILGICLGHQLIGWAFGGRTFKLKFGHRGGNHPVKDLITHRVTITSQNHGYAVDPEGLEQQGLIVNRINLNDGTVEGMYHRDLPILTLQYHPEANPGPWDSDPLFEEWIRLLK